MKPPTQKTTTNKPTGPVKVPARTSWRTPPTQAPAATPSTPPSQLPTLEALVGLAAAMATPTEKPAATARRAMELFVACEHELVEMKKSVAKRDAERKHLCEVAEYEQAFLSNFKEGSCVWYDSFKPGERVSVDDFLKACMPRSKEEDRMGKWRSFLALQLSRNGGLNGLPQLNKSESAEWAPKLVKKFQIDGLLMDLRLAGVRDAFLEFLESDCKAMKADKAAKSTRAKIVRPVSRKLLAGEKLYPDEEVILTGLTPAEIEDEIVKLKMNSSQAKWWKAAIEDLKVPPAGRPKVKKVRAG